MTVKHDLFFFKLFFLVFVHNLPKEGTEHNTSDLATEVYFLIKHKGVLQVGVKGGSAKSQ